MVTLVYAQGLPKLQGGSLCTSRIAQTLFTPAAQRGDQIARRQHLDAKGLPKLQESKLCTPAAREDTQTAGRQTLYAKGMPKLQGGKLCTPAAREDVQTAVRTTLYASPNGRPYFIELPKLLSQILNGTLN